MLEYQEPHQMSYDELCFCEKYIDIGLRAKLNNLDIQGKNIRKYEMGKWALGQIKNPKTDIRIRHKIRENHLEEIAYFVNYKSPELPEELQWLIEKQKEVLFWRKIVDIT